MFGVSHGKTGGTSMVNIPVQLVDGTSQGIVTIHEIGIDYGPDCLFTPVTYVSDSVRTGPLLWNLVFLVVEPFQGLERLVDIGPRQPRTGSTAIVSAGR